MAYTLSQKAEEDILNIFLYSTEQFGLKQAEFYHDLLEKSFQFLAENPMAARIRHEISPPVRIHPTESHIIIYTVEENGDISVIRVRHRYEDWVTDGDR